MLIFIALFGCSGDKEIEDDGDDTNIGTQDSAEEIECSEDGDCGNGLICESQECVDGDRNNGLEEAIGLLWEAEEYETLNPADDVDYFTFSAAGGEYIRIYTKTEYPDGDTVMTLRDADGKIVTWTDDYPTNSSVNGLDSVIYAYLPTAGEYLITVEDYNTYFGTSTDTSSTQYEYSLFIEEWSRHTEEPDDFGTSYEIEMAEANMWNSVGVVIGEESDADYVKIIHSADSSRLYISGIVNLDGSDLDPHLRLYNADGELLSEQVSVGPEAVMYYPMMENDDYTLEIQDANGNGGENFWTYLFLLAVEGESYPIEVENNNDFSTADEIELNETTSNNGNEYAFGRAAGTLETIGDEDWFVAENLYEDGYVLVCLNSTLYGSTMSPTIEIYDNSFELVGSIVADPESNPNAAIEGLQPPQGNYYIRVFSEAEEMTEGPSNWYQFLTYATTFEPNSYDCP